MKFFEEQRQNLAGKIQKKIIKSSDDELSSKIQANTYSTFYEIEQAPDQAPNGGNNRERVARIVNRQAPRRGGRGGRGGRVNGFRAGGPAAVPNERREREEAGERVPANNQDDEQRNQPREQRDDAYVAPHERNQEEQETVEEEANEEQKEKEEESTIKEEQSISIQDNQKVEETANKIEVENVENEQEIVGIQISRFAKMIINLFEFLQTQDKYQQIDAEQLEIDEENLEVDSNIIQNALEISLILEANRRNVFNEVGDILVFLKNSSKILEILQQILGDKFNETINQTIVENDLMLQDLLCYYAIYQIFKERANENQKKLFIQQENILKEKLDFITSLYEQNLFSSNKHLDQLINITNKFVEQNNKNTTKSYQVVATFMSVYTQNIEGIQVKNTDIFLQNASTNNSWKLSQASTKKLIGSLDRMPGFSQKLSSYEGSLIFDLHSNINLDEGVIQIKCVNLLNFVEFTSDKTIFTDEQMTNIKKYIAKEQSRISAKQQKSISEYTDENYKIKFYFEDGLNLKQFLLQNEFISVHIYNLPSNLRQQDLEEILSVNLQDQIQSLISQQDNKGKNYYQLTFNNKQQAKEFVEKSDEFQIMFNEEYVIITPHHSPSLQSISKSYSIDISIGKNKEVNYVLLYMRNKEQYQKIKKQQLFQQIEKYLKIKSQNDYSDLSNFRTTNLVEFNNYITKLQKEQIEDLFDIKFIYKCNYSTTINVQKIIRDQFSFQFDQILNFKSDTINVSLSESTKNQKEVQITLSCSNLTQLKKAVASFQQALKPIRYIPLESNKQKEVFFRADFIKTSRRKFTQSNFYTFFNTINMSFEFYHESQFNFTFLNRVSNTETYNSFQISEKTVEHVERLMQTFQNELNSYQIKQSYYVHPSLQEEFLQFIMEKGITKHTQNDKIFELEFSLELFLLLNKQIITQFVKASYFKKNEEIFKAKQSTKKAGSDKQEMPFCQVCYDSDHIFQLTNCSCRNYCRDCLREQIQIEVQDNYVQFKGIIHCPLCKKAPISLKDLSKLFNLYEIQSIMSQWVKCITYNYRNPLSGQKQFAHCIYPKCQGLIVIPTNLKEKAKKSENKVEMEIETEKQNEADNGEIVSENNESDTPIICEQCNNALCPSSIFDSKIPYHSIHNSSISCMDQYIQQRGDMPSNAKYCPSCSQVYFHETGCNHLTCYQCGEHFCSICNKNFGKNQGDIYTHIQECEQKQNQSQAEAEPVPETVQIAPELAEEVYQGPGQAWDEQVNQAEEQQNNQGWQ